jgi:hypothetical protein
MNNTINIHGILIEKDFSETDVRGKYRIFDKKS